MVGVGLGRDEAVCRVVEALQDSPALRLLVGLATDDTEVRRMAFRVMAEVSVDALGSVSDVTASSS